MAKAFDALFGGVKTPTENITTTAPPPAQQPIGSPNSFTGAQGGPSFLATAAATPQLGQTAKTLLGQ